MLGLGGRFRRGISIPPSARRWRCARERTHGPGDGQGDRQGTGHEMGQGTNQDTGQGDGPGDARGAWVTVAEAARRLGVTPRAVRNRMKRDTLHSRARGNEGREVFLPADMGQGNGSGDGQGTDQVMGPGDRQGDGDLHRRLAAAEQELAVAKAVALAKEAAAERVIDVLNQRVAELQAERDRMAELLRVALDRPSWLERLARALRGTGKPDAGPKAGIGAPP